MADIKLGKLKEVDIRKVRQHEQYDFSAWLAKECNITELWEALNLSLTDIETEKFVGSYRCDILCKDEITGKTVLIENQLEPTNHDHLWKIITYASWLDASVVVWIVEEAREEHASAIEWLNKHTDDEVAFFLVEVHAYTIWNSEPAPMFKIIEQPNDFAKTAKSLSKKWELTEAETRRLEFWEKLNEVIDERWKPFNKHKAMRFHWYSVAVWTTQCHIDINLLNNEHRIRVWLWIPDNKELFDRLYENKNEIESKLWKQLEWDRKNNSRASMVSTYIDWLDFDKQDNYHELMNKIIDDVVPMRKIFPQYF